MIRNLIIAASVLLFASCSKDEQDKLFGKWQIQQIEANGMVQAVDTFYFNFEHSLFMYQICTPNTNNFRISYGYNTVANNDSLLLELNSNAGSVENFIKFTDWSSGERKYAIEEVTNKRLILSSEGKKYTFRKF